MSHESKNKMLVKRVVFRIPHNQVIYPACWNAPPVSGE